jgi:repressor LexA
MKGLTKRQQEVLRFIKNYINEHQFPPTIREISQNFGISVRGAYDHIKALEKKSVIKCDTKRSRAIEVLGTGPGGHTERTDFLVEIPILGTVAAGIPILSEENYDGSVAVPANSIKSGKHYALRVRGDSMKDVGIMEGDVAIISYQSHANNGDIVVAMIDDAVTLKRFFKEKNRVRLKAENPEYPPIFTQDLRILGKLKQIVRSY